MNPAVHSRIASALDKLFQGYSGPAFALRFWDGWRWVPPTGEDPGCTIVIAKPKTLTVLLSSPDEISLGEAYIRRDLEIEGDLFSAFAVGEHLFGQPQTLRRKIAGQALKAILHLRRWTKDGFIHSKQRDRRSISYHYDQPVEFYRPWLGETIAYSCAYFASPQDALDQAQRHKIDLICRKLRLEPGQRFLDVGCGWGSLILHAAACGAQAQGITLSSGQAAEAQRRIDAAGLGSRCSVSLTDYRDLQAAEGSYDKIASVGMFEHVGQPALKQYFRILRTALKPGGALLNHGIARAHNSPQRNSSFVDKYVFPDGELVTLAEVVEAAESEGLEVRDVENLREHYEFTLRRWVEGLRANEAVVRQYVSDEIFRIWVLYMAGSAAAFHRGDIAVYQILLSRPEKGESRLPLRREDWYREAPTGELIEA